MPHEAHPLTQMDARVEAEGLVVLEDVTHMPAYGIPILSPHLILALNHSGWLRGEYDMDPVSFGPHDFAVVYPHHILTAHESSPDYRATLLVISPSMLELLRTHYPRHERFEHSLHPAFHLNEEQFRALHACFRALQAIARTDMPNRKELLSQQMDLMAHLVAHYMRKNGHLPEPKRTAVQQLLNRFHTAIAHHHHESREVRFYARLLNLSPKHFGTVVHQATGIRAGDWIARYVVLQAKYLLRHRLNLSIQQISERLGFPDQAAFAHYFKAYTGQTPRAYREQP